MKIKFLYILVSLILSSCASGPPKKYQVTEENLKNSNYGVIVGNIFVGGGMRPGIGIKKIGDKEKITIIGTKDFNEPFAIALPEGEYELISIGGRTNNYEPVKDPLRFFVMASEVVCIGSMYDSYGLALTNRKYSNEVVKEYGFKTIWGKLIDWSLTEVAVINTCNEIKTNYSNIYRNSNSKTFTVLLAK